MITTLSHAKGALRSSLLTERADPGVVAAEATSPIETEGVRQYGALLRIRAARVANLRKCFIMPWKIDFATN
jgi:hypothetical protein